MTRSGDNEKLNVSITLPPHYKAAFLGVCDGDSRSASNMLAKMIKAAIDAIEQPAQ